MQIEQRWRRGAVGMVVAFALLAIPSALSAQTPATIELGNNAELGDILVAGSNGLTLYLFTPDEQGDSVCYDECEATWPPLARVRSKSASFSPAMTRAAILAIGRPLALATKGTVRLARGLTSRM